MYATYGNYGCIYFKQPQDNRPKLMHGFKLYYWQVQNLIAENEMCFYILKHSAAIFIN